MISRSTIAFTASYYGLSPLEVELWPTRLIQEWADEAIKLEEAKAKAFKKGLDGQKS